MPRENQSVISRRQSTKPFTSTVSHLKPEFEFPLATRPKPKIFRVGHSQDLLSLTCAVGRDGVPDLRSIDRGFPESHWFRVRLLPRRGVTGGSIVLRPDPGPVSTCGYVEVRLLDLPQETRGRVRVPGPEEASRLTRLSDSCRVSNLNSEIRESSRIYWWRGPRAAATTLAGGLDVK